ncbi:MAG: hypothetical protein A2157_07040 [Deltaproteobacteria bacterium RBG_16_47_11]|nr:MAG: hypothetical protein A2157_07040 [Deltaproteobacteria bacterium RBG_16_47_11]
MDLLGAHSIFVCLSLNFLLSFPPLTLPLSPLRRGRVARLDHELPPFGIDPQVAFHGFRTARMECSDVKEGSLFSGLSPPNRKIALSEVPWCLVSILGSSGY